MLFPDGAAAAESLSARFDSPEALRQPPYLAPWDDKMLYFPRWMFGEWRVTSTFKAVHLPLGRRFVPEGYLQASDAPADEGGPGSVYSYTLRYYSTLPDTFDNNARVLLGLGMPHDAIIPDRAFNTKSTSDAFLGYEGAVQSVEYDPSKAPLRQTVTLSTLGPDAAPLPPRRIELYINALHREESQNGDAFYTSELARQVFVAVRDVKVSDYEVLNEFRKVGPGKVVGRQRSILYLNPQDELFFQAGNRGVAVYDYDFEMERVPSPADAPPGAVACVTTPKDVAQCV